MNIQKKCGYYLLFIVLNSVCFHAYADSPQPQSLGNFGLAASQAPGPFFSFGQNIIDKYETQVFWLPNYSKYSGQYYAESDQTILYGLTDNASVLVTVPVAVDYKLNTSRSSGFADTSLQGEYAFYNASTATYTQTATVVAAMSLPTGSYNKTPATGYGASSFFFGGTFNRTYSDWLWFASSGALVIAPHDGYLAGAQYLYQSGIGKTLFSKPDRYISMALLEFDDQYYDTSQSAGFDIPNSGGNVLYVTPSFWLSTQRWIVQLGISLPLTQHWKGQQSESDYYIAASFGWTLK